MIYNFFLTFWGKNGIYEIKHRQDCNIAVNTICI